MTQGHKCFEIIVEKVENDGNQYFSVLTIFSRSSQMEIIFWENMIDRWQMLTFWEFKVAVNFVVKS